MDKISKSVILSISIVALLFAIYVVLMGAYPYIDRVTNKVKFDPNSWKAQSGKSKNMRWYMIDDLFSKYEINKLSKKQIIKLLGEPDGLNSKDSIYYLLGVHTTIDEHVLVIFFNESQKVTRYFIVDS